jgi:RNA polymerase sigma-70 factor (ECF subfamily)
VSTITRNVAIDAVRARRSITVPPDDLVDLAGVWGLTAREIAERDGIPLGTAKTRIRIALSRLRESVLRDGRAI